MAKTARPKVHFQTMNDRSIINGSVLQDESGEVITIAGRHFDIDAPENFGKVLSTKDKVYRSCVVDEFGINPVCSLKTFIEYLMRADVLVPVDGYGSVAYYPRGVKKDPDYVKTYDANHATFAALSGIGAKRWDPSEVLYDLVSLYSFFDNESGLHKQAAKLIKTGYEVKVKVL